MDIIAPTRLIQWKIVNGDGHEDHPYEGKRYDSREEALEDCDWLHEKYDLDTGEDYGVYSPWFVPVLAEKVEIRDDEFTVVRYSKELA